MIIDSKIYRGADSSAGEIGHMSINYDGPVCKCGNNGCLETYVASHVILNRVKALLSKTMTPIFKDILEGEINNLTIKQLFSAYKKEDEAACYVLDDVAKYVGTGLAGVVNLLNPEVVVVGGGIADGGGGFLEDVSKEVNKRAFTSATENLSIIRAALGNDAGFIGAGLLGES